MSGWNAISDSKAYRWLVKRGPTAALFRSGAFARLNRARTRALARAAVRAHPDRYAATRTFCFFVGHVKCGTSLLGAMLDAHPNVICADEVDAIGLLGAGFSRDEVFHLLRKGAVDEARKGRVTARRLGGYGLAVPGGSQGRVEVPLAIGDGRAGPTTKLLAADPTLLDRLPSMLPGVEVRVFMVLRNPFDPIALSMIRGKRTFEDAAARFFATCETLVQIQSQLPPGSLHRVRYEDVVADPTKELAAACAFLGVEAPEDYLAACAAIVHPAPDRDRDRISWTPQMIRAVEAGIARFDFLSPYEQEVPA
ncbi:MAG: sulfotransferase family protein [Planctomycetaceae bacterium]